MDSGAAYSGERWALHHGDALDVLRTMPDAGVDALVTDPPAGIGFMGRAWDGDLGGRAQWVATHAAIFAECRRVLVPGAHAIVWALPRTSHWTATALEDAGFEVRDVAVHLQAQGWPKSRALLKPAAEHWVLCRTPGTGYSASTGNESVPPNTLGRWPANVTLEHAAECGERCAEGCPAAMLDAQSGMRSSGSSAGFVGGVERGVCFGAKRAMIRPETVYGDSGASRFFYCAKAKGGRRGGAAHPTVKPVDLMRWLCRLVATPGASVLDPFAGSGTTGVAALADGMRFVGIEREAAHVATARERLTAATRQTTLSLTGSEP